MLSDSDQKLVMSDLEFALKQKRAPAQVGHVSYFKNNDSAFKLILRFIEL